MFTGCRLIDTALVSCYFCAACSLFKSVNRTLRTSPYRQQQPTKDYPERMSHTHHTQLLLQGGKDACQVWTFMYLCYRIEIIKLHSLNSTSADGHPTLQWTLVLNLQLLTRWSWPTTSRRANQGHPGISVCGTRTTLFSCWDKWRQQEGSLSSVLRRLKMLPAAGDSVLICSRLSGGKPSCF